MLGHAAERGKALVHVERPFNDEGVHSNPVIDERPTFQDIVDARVSRRGIRKGISVLALGAGTASIGGSPALASTSSLTFKELPHGNDDTFHVSEGYDHTVLIRWGDPVEGGAPPFDPMQQTVDAQLKQFGSNNDFIGYFPLPAGSKNSDHGLLVINHEYTNTDLMFSGLPEKDFNDALTREQVGIEMAAHGLSVIEVKKEGGKWTVVANSRYARRITSSTTEMRDRPCRGTRAPEDLGRPDRHAGNRHAQQLRGRGHPVGHRHQCRRELQRLLQRRRRRHEGSRQSQALRPAQGQLVWMAPLPRPLGRREGAQRAQPLRLDGRVRP